MSETPQATDGVADAARGLSDSARTRVRQEVAAAQLEMLNQAKQALPTIGLLGAAGLFGVLSLAASYRLSVRLLEKSMPPDAAALVAAAGYGVAAGVAGSVGVQRLRAGRPLVRAEAVRETVASVTGTAKAVAGTAAKTATDTAKTFADAAKTATGTTAKTAADTAKTVTDTAKTAADTAAETAAETAKTPAGTTTRKAAGTTARAATAGRSTTRRKAAPEQPAPEQPASEQPAPEQPGTSS